jgi:hypothetical protein
MKLDKLIVESSYPKVGIFWFIGKETVIFSEEARNISAVAGFKNYHEGHADVWNKVVKAYPQVRGKEYFEVPRGRVLFDVEAGKYIIYVSAADSQKKNKMYEVMRQFSLPIQKTIIRKDLHYDLDPGPEFDID